MAIAASAFAQHITVQPFVVPTVRPWNAQGIGYWGGGVNTVINGFSKDAEVVSGTNVNFSFTVTAPPIPTWAPYTPTPVGTHPYNRVRITSIVLKIGGTNVYSGAGSPTALEGDMVTKNVRYASTHFDDDQSVEIKLDATVELSCVDDGNPGTIPPPYTLVCPTLTITNKMYNKGLTLATKEEFYDPPADNSTPPVDPPPGYYVPPTPFTDGFATASQNTMPFARSALTGMKHTILNSQDLLRETNLDPLFKQATTFLGFTHGELDHFRACEIDQVFFTPTSSNEVKTYVQGGRTAPQMNMVVLHACSTLGGGSMAPVAFGVMQQTVPQIDYPDRAMSGFTAIVWSIGQNSMPIDQHAKYLYGRLAAGDTIKEAVDAANRKYGSKNDKQQALKMVYRGDYYARLINVYQSKSEWSESRRGSWYWVRD